MATTLTINQLKWFVDFTYEITEDVVNPTRNGTPFQWAMSMADGVGLNQMNRLWWDERTLAASGNETLDLSALTGTAFGTITLARVKLLAIRIPYASAGGASLQIGGAGSNPFVAHLGGTTPTYQVRNGGMDIKVAPDATGFAVGTGVNLKVTNNDSGAGITYQIVIGGGAT